MLDHELVRGAEPEQHGHAAIAAVEKASPSRACPILRHGQRANVAELAAVEVSRSSVVHGVGLFPIAEGKQCDQSKTGTDPLIGSPAGKIRAVAAIVLDDEQPYV